jgi:hypothetical protein
MIQIEIGPSPFPGNCNLQSVTCHLSPVTCHLSSALGYNRTR